MKAFQNGSYRVRLLLVFGVSILLVTVATTLAQTIRSYQYLSQDFHSHLELLAEQALLNFESETTAVARQFMNQITAMSVPDLMYRQEGEEAPVTMQQSREFAEALSRTITANGGFDAVYVRTEAGMSYANTFADAGFIHTAAEILEAHGEKTYGSPVWVRAEDGLLYLVRDVYHQEPFHYVGKALARLRNPSVIDLGSDSFSSQCAVAFFGEGELIALTGKAWDQETGLLDAARERGSGTLDHYLVAVKRSGNWEAIALLPESALGVMSASLIRTGLVIILIGIALGSVAVFLATRSMTRQMRALLGAMDEAAGGDLNVRAPITSGDEIGQLSVHFNTMLDNNQRLMSRLVQEEKQKNQAEYDALEYKYRSLQSQINPHFIYNAMEVVNAMAKLDGQEEICEVVGHISSFFRQNTRNMEKKFIPVRREFDSLREYAYIFRHIYGSVLETPFSCEPEVEKALIPTMILQPLLENALVHGIRSEDAVVSIRARRQGEARLIIEVEDNGDGIDADRLRQLLDAAVRPDESEEKKSGGVGLRNVRDRLRLIYGEEATLGIRSEPGVGTTVTIELPLRY